MRSALQKWLPKCFEASAWRVDMPLTVSKKKIWVMNVLTDVSFLLALFVLLWNRNTGPECHRLKRCEFAGWDSEQQFSLSSVSYSKPQHIQAAVGPAQGSRDGEVENGEDVQTVRVMERNFEIVPGEKLCVTVRCQARWGILMKWKHSYVIMSCAI